eukprot:33627-Karenia_brevis.AAC.1
MVQCRNAPMGPLRDTLLEVKKLHYGPSTYPRSEERCPAVARRAAAIEGEYLVKDRVLDRQFLGAPGGQVDPRMSTGCSTKLRSL